MKLLELKGVPIWRQLAIEEALLRADEDEWCLINQGSPPAVVVGISGKIDELVDLEETKRQGIPIYRRFSGGGTVVVDESTLFVTLIGRHETLPCSPFPEPIMRWSAELYKQALGHPDFSLQANDYALGEKKFGGNAQYLSRGRWLHHTSLLWDYSEEKMRCLQMPPRTPEYRNGRSHTDFVCRLCDHFPSQETLIEGLKKAFLVKEVDVDLEEILARPHRRATEKVHC